MKKINRHLDLQSEFRSGRVTTIYGPRRVGKTTLANDYIKTLNSDSVFSTTSDDIRTQDVLSSQNLSRLLDFAGSYKTIFIDEAQRVKDIGINLKMLIDAKPDLRIIATGSASFDLQNKTGEPLTGRQTPLTLFPISILELKNKMSNFEIQNKLSDFLLFGMYPEIITVENSNEKKFILSELVNAYLLKDALELEKIKSSKTLLNLLRLLAYQIGNEVNHTELANALDIDQKTVSRYLDILEKCFVVYNLRGFSKNLRSEVVKSSKYYFYDVGIRNALISNYNDIYLRPDRGALFENFIFMEKLKFNKYKEVYSNLYFWRTYEQKEIDIIEEMDGLLHAFEIKYNPSKKTIAPKQWTQTYGDHSTFKVINHENFLEFIT
jgi:predicted AAA+ superfamily ATPase